MVTGVTEMLANNDNNYNNNNNNAWLNILHLLVFHKSKISTYLKICKDFKNNQARNWGRQVLCSSIK
jgi:hypothetical protein